MIRILLTLLVLVAASAPDDGLRRLDFAADPGWESHRSRLVPEQLPITRQDFGYRDTNRAGGQKVGEIGGRVQRSATPASYAKVIPEKTLKDRLSASGKFSVTFDDNGNGVLFGWFNSASHGWRADNSLVFRLDGNGQKYWVFYEYGTRHWLTGGAGCFEGKKYQETKTKPLASDGTSHEWSLSYDPDGNGGNGLVKFVLDTVTYELPLAPGHKEDGATFNRFGILNQQTTGGTIEAYIDDLVLDGQWEEFGRDPKWEARGNQVEFPDRVKRPRHDFGYSAMTNYAGGKAGEIGGVIWRDDRAAWYADRVGPLTFRDELFASGTIAFTGAGSDSGVYLAWFDADSNNVDAKTKRPQPKNLLGIFLEGPSRVGHYFRPAYATASGEWNAAASGPILRPDGQVHRFTIRYVPATSRITVTLDDKMQTLDIPAAHREIGARFDHFGLFTYSADGNHVIVYVDDLAYTAKATPQ